MTALPPYLRRGAALTILALLLGAAGWIATSLESAWREERDGIATQRELLGKLTAIAGRARDVDAAIGAARGHPGRAWFMTGDSEALVAAQLQQRLQDIAAGHGAQFLRASEAEPLAIEGQAYRGLRIELAGSLESLQRILLDVETGVPYLFITRAQIGADQSFQEDAQTPPQLQADLDIYGALLPAEMTALAAAP